MILFLLLLGVLFLRPADFGFTGFVILVASGVALVGGITGICQWRRLGVGQRCATVVLGAIGFFQALVFVVMLLGLL
jgi:hypothetical protein